MSLLLYILINQKLFFKFKYLILKIWKPNQYHYEFKNHFQWQNIKNSKSVS